MSTLTVRVTPRAARTEVVGFVGDVLHVRLSAPPVDDAANAACCALIAGELKVAKSNVTVVKGRKSREKRLLIEGAEPPWPWQASHSSG